MHQRCDLNHVEIAWDFGPCPLCAAIEALERALDALNALINEGYYEEKAS